MCVEERHCGGLNTGSLTGVGGEGTGAPTVMDRVTRANLIGLPRGCSGGALRSAPSWQQPRGLPLAPRRASRSE